MTVNRAARPDDKPPLFGRAARLVAVAPDRLRHGARRDHPGPGRHPAPARLRAGRTPGDGIDRLRPRRTGAGRDVHEGVRGLPDRGGPATAATPASASSRTRARGAGKSGSPGLVALSDGPKPPGHPELRETRVAVSLFSLVVNDRVPVRDLSLADIRRVYAGEIRNWRELGGPDLEILLVSRDANPAPGRCSSAGSWTATNPPSPPATAPPRTTRGPRSPAANSTAPTRSWPPSPGWTAPSATANCAPAASRAACTGSRSTAPSRPRHDRHQPPARPGNGDAAYTFRPPARRLPGLPSFLGYLSRAAAKTMIATSTATRRVRDRRVRICGED
ncbi:Substrate-binding domain-containing protein OS=Streptomyces microflavus OX=1919 GN=HUT09_15695 PE=4 SV=1 [Streptomyces microflavus]